MRLHSNRSFVAPVNTDCGEGAALHRPLAHFNRERIRPRHGEVDGAYSWEAEQRMLALETQFIEASRAKIAFVATHAPTKPAAFVQWFEQLAVWGPGQGDPLFPWLAESASLEQMRWFLEQEVAGEAGFDDLVAMTQVKMPTRAKLEMARNYWDEMGRGSQNGMHGLMLENLANHLNVTPLIETTVPESLALGNMMMALACNRRYAFHSIGALGVIELTAPSRAQFVSAGLNRLGVSRKQSHYFQLHAVLDVKHSEAWNAEILASLIADDPCCAPAIAEGALMRLSCGLACFERYRKEFDLR